MDRRPLVAIACCFAAGTALHSLVPDSYKFAVLAGLLLLLVGIATSGKAGWKLALLCAAALLVSTAERWWVERGDITQIRPPTASEQAEARLTGFISSVVEVDGDLATFRLRAVELQSNGDTPGVKIRENVLVRVKLKEKSEQQTASAWTRGDGVAVTGELGLPGDAGNFGAFDYRAYLRKTGIHWILTAKGTDAVTAVPDRSPFDLQALRTLDRFRAAIGNLMDRLYPGDDAGYMKGLVAGIRSDFDPDQFDAFARLGLTHILAISGLHVGVVVLLLLRLGALARLPRERSIGLTIAAMPVYMLATGASPSAVRACLMAMLALWLARRQALKDGLHLVAAAALVMLIWEPRLIEDIGFQLSFVVTTGLLLFVPITASVLPIRWKWLKDALTVTVVAQVVSFPLTAYYFHSFHLLSLPANFLLVPFISFLVMPLGMVSVALGAAWQPLGEIPAMLASKGNQLTFLIVDWLDAFNRLRTVWPQPSLLWVVSGFALMGISAHVLKRKMADDREKVWWLGQQNSASGDTAPLTSGGFARRRASGNIFARMSVAALAVCWLLWGARPAFTDAEAKIMFLDVGQGDSILIRTGAGRHILVDAGGTSSFRKPGDEWRERRTPYDIGRKLIVPLLLERGVRQLDALVLTHLDADHIGGAKAVISQLPVRRILFNGTIKDAPGAIELFRLALDRNIPCYALHASMNWKVDDSTLLEALYPAAVPDNSPVEIRSEQNGRSVVLLLHVYGRVFLLPGDLEAAGEKEIVAAETARGRTQYVDVLKAGHHGSKTSTSPEWLRFWAPGETIISAGANNRYGHPHPTVVDRLAAYGSAIFRTDRDGEIQYRIKPDGAMYRKTKRQV